MKRRTRIAKELAALRAQSHPEEFHGELRRIVIQDAAHEPNLRRLLRELEDRYPEAYERATKQPKRSVNWQRDIHRYASWLEAKENGVSQTRWLERAKVAIDARRKTVAFEPLDKKTLRDLRKRYEADSNFRACVEEFRTQLRTV